MRKALVLSLALSLFCVLSLPRFTATTCAQSLGGLERGYRTGYSDGYVAGYRDTAQHRPYDFRNNSDFRRADRAYAATYGSVEDYRDGYQQGFGAGYDDGYQNRGYNSAIPNNISPKGTVSDDDVRPDPGNSSSSNVPDYNGGSSISGGNRPVGPAPSSIPSSTLLLVEMLDSLSTEKSQRGDRFQARVIEPAELEGAIVEGHVEKAERPGRAKGTAHLQLAFDTIRIDSGGDSRLKAQVVEVVALRPGDKVEAVDTEGGVRGRASKARDMVKIGFGTAVGAVIGAIFGGGKGAAAGAAIGGGATGANVLTSRGNEISLNRGQQMRLRTSGNTQLN
jgi:hypothetical protein